MILWTEGRSDETVSTGISFRRSSSTDANGSATTLQIAVPPGTVNNDVMIAGITVRPYTAVITPPAGWTLVLRQDQTASTDSSIAVYRRTASSEPASYTWSFNTSTGSGGGIMSFSGVDTTTPLDVAAAGASSGAAALTAAAPSVTTASANTMLVTFHALPNSDRWTPPAGMTEAFDVASLAPSNGVGISIEANYAIQAAAGASGTKTATTVPTAQAADVSEGITLALRPSATAGTQAYFGFGMTDGTTSKSVSASTQNAAATATSSSRIASKALTIVKWGNVVLAEADLQSWDASNFTLNWTTNDATAYVIHYLAIGGSDVSAKVVGWTSGSGTGQRQVTGVGFQPALVLHAWENYQQTAAPPSNAAREAFGLGAMDSNGDQWATAFFGTSGVTTSNTQRGQQTDGCVFSFSGALAVQKKASFYSMDVDGFTVNFTNANNSNNIQLFSLALAGLNASVGNFLNPTGAAPVSQSITGVNFKPSAVLLASFQDVVRASPVTDARFGIGASDGTTQGSSALVDLDAQGTTVVSGIDKTSKVFVKLNGVTPTLDAEADLTSMDVDGFTLNWTTNDAVATQMLYLALGPLAATEVGLTSFTAARYERGVLLQWRTGYESNNLGFNLYREIGGVRTKINGSLIAGSGLQTVNVEQNYARWDVDAAAAADSVLYWLEDVDFNGTLTMHGPVSPAPGGLQSVTPTVTLSSTDLNDVGDPHDNRTVFFDIPDDPVRVGRRDAQWDLASQSAIKIGVKQAGWYRITQPDLVAAGLDASVDPHRLRLFLNGIEQAIRVSGEDDGHFDPADAVEFYGTGANTPYTDTRFYWLVAGAGDGVRVGLTTDPASGPAGPTSVPALRQRKDRSVYFAALNNGDAENWFGPVISTEPTDLTLATLNVDRTAADAQIDVTLQGVTTNTAHAVGVLVNGVDVGEVDFDGPVHLTQTLTVPLDALNDGANTVTLVARSGDQDISLVDLIGIRYQHRLRADADLLRFTVDGGLAITVGGFADSSIHVIDITDLSAVTELHADIQPEAGGLYAVSVQAAGSGPRTLLAFSDLTVGPAATLSLNQPSAWHAAGQAHNYVVISHADFLDKVAPLAALRTSQGHHVAVVDVEDVYDEFSFGEKTPQALRDFLQWARGAWQQAPHFVVLVGDATIDPRDYSELGAADFVPTKQVAMTQAALEAASDDWFSDFDDDGVAEIAIGRLSVRTPAQAESVIGKIVAYDAVGAAAWTKNVLLVADESDANSNFDQTNVNLTTTLPAGYTPTRIFRGATGDDEAHQSLIDRVNEGQLIVNYNGHGSVHVWSDGNPPLLQNPTDGQPLDDVRTSWRNVGRLPLVVAMNCLNGLFNGIYDEESLAEALQRASDGGAVAVWASSSVTSAATQALVDQELFRVIFQTDYGTIGDAIAAAKRVVSSPDLRRSWVFFGDPAMRLNGVVYVPPPPPTPPAPPSSGGSAPSSAPATGAGTDPAPEPPAAVAPIAPTNLTSSVSGSTVVLSWQPPASGNAQSYIIEAGAFAGARDFVHETGTPDTSFIASGVGAGTYFVRVRARNATGVSGVSNEVIVSVGTAAPGATGTPSSDPVAPGPPLALRSIVAGSTVTFVWLSPASGGAPQTYWIDAGSSAGLSDLASFSTGNTATAYTVASVPAGTYYVRVRAANGYGASSASNETVVSIVGATSCVVPPDAPTGLHATVSGSTVMLGWTASNGSPGSYLIEAGSSFGAADLVVTDSGSTATTMVATSVGSGTYFVRVRGRNACGLSGASNEAVIVVP